MTLPDKTRTAPDQHPIDRMLVVQAATQRGSRLRQHTELTAMNLPLLRQSQIRHPPRQPCQIRKADAPRSPVFDERKKLFEERGWHVPLSFLKSELRQAERSCDLSTRTEPTQSN